MNTRQVIDLFYDEGRKMMNEERYEAGFALENIGSQVNNAHHGVPASEWLPKVHQIAVYLLEREKSEDGQDGYRQALGHLKMLAEKFNVALPE